MKFSKRLNDIQEYYFSKKLEEVRKLDAQGKNIINLGIGSPDLPPSENTVNALIASAKDPSHHSYQPYRSTKELRAAMSKWYLETYNVIVDSDREILPLLGSKEGVFYLSMAMLDEGDEALVPNPGYPAYSSSAKIAGAKVSYYNLKEENGWYPDLNELENMDLSRVKIMWINYPNMPTGAKADREVMKKLVDLCRKKDILLCNDNPYSMVLNDEQVSLLEFDSSRQVSAELNSFSKSFNMAGWRVGMLMANENIINAVLQVKSNVDSGMFRPLQDAAAAALQNENEWHDNRNNVYKERRELVCIMLDKMNCIYNKDQVGMFVWAKVPDTVGNTEEFIDRILYEAGVFITPGKIFGSNGERYIRVSLCANKNKIIEATKRIENVELRIEN